MMKVVWLCHFANAEMKTFFRKPQVKEMAPWINNLLVLFQERKDLELHVVAPNVFTNKQQEILLKNVHYHFYQYRPYFIPKKVHSFFRFESRTNYYWVKQRIAKIIININPDIIHLHGAENPYYSAGILPLIDCYPNLVTIQGFIRNTTARDIITNKRIQIEEEILKKTKHIGVRTKDMSEIAVKLNPGVKLHFHRYESTIPAYMKDRNMGSKFDIVFFAKITKDKGIEDLLEAMVLVKKEKPDVLLNIIGYAGKSYLSYLKNIVERFNIKSNVKFLGFMETQQDVYKHAVEARICVLPTYHDIIPGTIIESMFMKLPVIAYAVGGIPELNIKGQAVVLVEKNNIQQLANEIVSLLKDKSKRDSLAESAFNFAQEKFQDKNTVDEIMRVYDEILSV